MYSRANYAGLVLALASDYYFIYCRGVPQQLMKEQLRPLYFCKSVS
jgi:hypothetical protein